MGILLLTIAVSQRSRALSALGHWLDVGESPAKADYILILGGAYESRPFAAAALVRAGVAGRVLVPRTRTDLESLMPGEDHQTARKVLLARGVPDKDIVFLAGKGATTYDEARALAALLAAAPQARVDVVTSDYHTRRARWVFEQVLGDFRGRIHFISVPCESFTADNWWSVEEGFIAYSKESMKLAFYVLYYGHAAVWAALATAGALLAAWTIRRMRSTKGATVEAAT